MFVKYFSLSASFLAGYFSSPELTITQNGLILLYIYVIIIWVIVTASGSVRRRIDIISIHISGDKIL
jgi:hypothetical protein